MQGPLLRSPHCYAYKERFPTTTVLLEALRGYGLRAEVVLTRSADEERLSILHAWQDSMLKTNS